MAQFDMVEAAGYGYKSCWAYKSSILRLAGLPILVKLGCVAAVIFFGMEEDFLRQGLVMLPAYFAEGILVAYIVRAFCDGKAVELPKGFEYSFGRKMRDGLGQARDYYADILSGMIVYVLIKLALSFLIGMTFASLPEGFPQTVPAQNVESSLSQSQALYSFMVASSSLVFVIWSFRFLWLYVPVAMGINLTSFLKRIRAFSSSFYMLGCWLMCYVPFVIIVLFLSSILLSLFAHDGEGYGDLALLLVSSLQALVELVTTILSSVAMAYAFKTMMQDDGHKSIK